ncbi:mitochondrial mRNA pseudouridine synthase RPUSD3-like isoform X1 [Leucoraja erinacea]|uniref:mitochondrial mRNA pseudouridine synthase RPUSD3-like isoform X1 n=1 Tax=Leucoraja erinaceus TaxID=7782 RepID=UPI0024563C18|nr:mitochondrial mRNA pseudouridine synthase RPUSD3-like isoform X1 [Leucoraja erinacea]
MNQMWKQTYVGTVTLASTMQGQSCPFVRRLVTNLASSSLSTVPRSNIKPKGQMHKQRQHVKSIKGVSILQDPGIPVLRKLTRQGLVELIASSVVYQEYPLIGINKPAGLSITGRDLCLISLLPDLQHQLQLSEMLHVVKASHRDHSGLVLLSTCHQTTQNIENAFIQARRKKEVITSYCAVTVGVPEPEAGEINIALKQQSIGEHKMVVPVFHSTAGNFRRKEAKKAITQYQVLDAANGCALVQLQPLATFESMLEVHLTLKLCTVLGDHVYSGCLGKVLDVPFHLPVESVIPRTQVLDETLLQKLHMDQNHMWKMPIHLHLQRLTIPPFGTKKSETVITAAPLPYFSRNLELLGLTKNEFVDKSTKK